MKAEWQRQLVFTNDFKILFCNAFNALNHHSEICEQCRTYLFSNGDGDLCDKGKATITKEMELQEPIKSV